MRPLLVTRLLLAGLFLAVLVSFCAPERDAAFLLFFGRDIAGTGTVSDEDWANFESTVIAPALSQYTILDGRGRSTTNERIGIGNHEETIILVMVASDTDESVMKLSAISDEYKEAFSQQSVFLVKAEAEILSGGGQTSVWDTVIIFIMGGLGLIALVGAFVSRRRSNEY